MKHSFWITLAISIVLCIVALVGLGARNKALTEKLAKAQEGASAEPGTSNVEANTARGGTAADEANESESGERVRRARTAVAGYVAAKKRSGAQVITVVRPGKEDFKMYMPEKNDPYSVRQLPELLRAVEGLSVDELIATIKGLPAEEQPYSGAKGFLLELAILQDPRKVYGDQGLLEGYSELGQLGILALFDPAAALSRLPPLDPSAREGGTEPTEEEREARIQFATMLLGMDVERGLQALLEARKSDPGRAAVGEFTSAEMAEACIPELMEAMQAPEYAGLREGLIRMTLNHTLIDSGMETVAERAQTMQLTPQELDGYLETLMRADVMSVDPAGAIQWMAEVGSNRVPAALLEWAKLDLAAATNWLGAQEPSPIRDQAIAKFAVEASELDRESAAQWAKEIRDERLREQTLRRIPGN